MNKIQLLDPKLLKPLPQIKAMPRFAVGTDEFNGAVEDVREHGVKHPLQITAENFVVDGESRRQWAVAAMLTEVPVQIVSADEAYQIILRELNCRRNLTKSQRAYIGADFFQEAVTEGLRKKGQNLRNSPISSKDDSIVNRGARTAQELALSMGISHDLLQQALKLRKLFAKDEDLRAEWEPKIMDAEKPVGLGAAIAGIAGAGAEQPNRDKGVLTGQMELFGNSFEELRKGVAGWKKFDPQQKQIVIKAWQKTVAAMPDDLREAMIEALEVK